MKNYQNGCPSGYFLLSLVVVKLVATLIFVIFPQESFEVLYPIMLFSPLFLAALALYSIPEWILAVLLGGLLIMVLCLLAYPFLIFSKRRSVCFVEVVLIALFVMEALSCFLSLMIASFTLGKIIGMIYHIVLVNLVCKQLRMRRS